MLDAGYPLSAGDRGALPALARPCLGGSVRLLPMTDDRVETHVAIADPDAPSGRRVVHFQEYWVRLRAEVPAEARGRRRARRRPRPGPGVIDAITDADLVLLPPSNPVVSVGTILGVPRVREALVATQAPGRRPLPHRRRHPRARHGRAAADRDRRRGQRGRRRPALRRPRRRRRARRLAGRRGATPTRSPGCTRPGSPAAAVPLMMTDHDATAAMAAAARRAGRRMSALERRSRPTASPRSRPGDDLAALLLAALSTSPTATSSW